MIARAKELFKSMKLDRSDLFLLCSVVFGLFIFVEYSILTSVANPTTTYFPFWLIVVCFVGLICCISFFFYFKREMINNKQSIAFLFIFILLVVVNMIVTFVKPDSISTIIKTDEGNVLNIVTDISFKVKLSFVFAYTSILLGLFVAIIVLPKRITSLKFFRFISILVCSATLVLLIYSLISERDNYSIFFSKIFDNPDAMYNIDDYAPKSIFPHRNVYAMMIEFALISALIDYSIFHNKVYLVFVPALYLNIVLTFCKAAIVSCALILVVWIFFKCITSFKKDSSFERVFFSICSGIVVLLGLLLFVFYFTIPSFAAKIDYIHHFGNTLRSREIIWRCCWQIITSNSLIFGTGYGVYNAILFNVNSAVIGDPMSVSHSFIFSILGRGGILVMILYVSLLMFAVYLAILLFKKDKEVALAMLLSFIVFFFHSLIEDNYYILVIVIVELFIACERYNVRVIKPKQES